MKPTQLLLAAVAALALGAPQARAFTPANDNLTNGNNWNTGVSQDPSAAAFGPGGLTIATNPFGNPLQFQRQAVASNGGDFSWLTAPGAVTYSFTLSDFANPTTIQNGGYEANMLLIGNQAQPLPNFADFNAANAILFRVVDLGPAQGGGNSYGAELLYKTGQASQSIFPAPFGVGTKVAAMYNETSPLGRWSITLSGQNAFITDPTGHVSQPGQFTGSGHFNSDVLTAFNQNAHVYLQANNGQSAAGDSITFSNFQAIPEPSTWASLALGLGALWLRRRKMVK